MPEHGKEKDCGCLACYLAKRLQFADGVEVKSQGEKVVAMMDITVMADAKDGHLMAIIGIDDKTRISHILAAIGALARQAHNMIGTEVPMYVPGNPEDKN